MTLKVVIDTNIWISGMFWKGSAPSKVLDKFEEEIVRVFFSKITFSEWDKKVSEAALKLARTEEYYLYRKNILRIAGFVYPKEEITICRDPKDNMILEAAAASEAEYLITGDRDLLDLKKFKNIVICTPSDFLELNP